MVVPPINGFGDEEKAASVNTEFFKPLETTQKKETPKPVKPKIEPDLNNIAGQPSIAWLPADSPEIIKARREALLRRADIAQRDNGLEIIGRWYANDNWSEALPVLRSDFLALCRKGYYRLASNEFKLLPKQIQSELLRGLLQSSELKDFLPFIDYLSQNGSIPEEMKAEVSTILKAEDKPFHSIERNVNKLQRYLGQIKEYAADNFGAYDFESFQKEIERTGNPDLIREFDNLRKAFMVCERSIVEIEESARSPEELAEHFSAAVLALRKAAHAFKATADAAAVSFQQPLVQGLEHDRDLFNRVIAEKVRSQYESAGVVLKLDVAAYNDINESLERLGMPLLSGMFCANPSGNISDSSDLDFLKDSYELNTPQNLNNLNISVRFVYELANKIREAEELKQSLLQNIKKEEAEIVEKFLKEYVENMKQFYKRLDKVEKKEKLQQVEICLNSYVKVLAQLKETGNPLSASGAKLSWFSMLAETERWKKTAQALLDYTKSSVA